MQAAYHVTEDFFLQAEAGRSKAGRTSFETLSNIPLLTDTERWFKYYDLSVGYNFLPGEVFIGRNHAMTSSFYILGGVGATDFGGDSKFTVNFGAGYKVLPTDWLAVHVAVEDRVFNSDLLGVNKLASNLEAHRHDRLLLGVSDAHTRTSHRRAWSPWRSRASRSAAQSAPRRRSSTCRAAAARPSACPSSRARWS